MSARKVVVITQGSRVVGTQVVLDPPAGQPAASAALHAGPGQKLHVLDVVVPEAFADAKAMLAFHATVQKQLKAKKPARKKRR